MTRMRDFWHEFVRPGPCATALLAATVAAFINAFLQISMAEFLIKLWP